MQPAISKDLLWEKLDQLNPLQQKTVLAYIDSLLAVQSLAQKSDKSKLLDLSVWSTEDIQPIQEAQERINAWQPPIF